MGKPLGSKQVVGQFLGLSELISSCEAKKKRQMVALPCFGRLGHANYPKLQLQWQKQCESPVSGSKRYCQIMMEQLMAM